MSIHSTPRLEGKGRFRIEVFESSCPDGRSVTKQRSRIGGLAAGVGDQLVPAAPRYRSRAQVGSREYPEEHLDEVQPGP
jgi:hypothetical protein